METNACSIEPVVKTEGPALVSKSSRPGGTIVDVNGIRIGGREIVIMAGPCAVENEEQLSHSARSVRAGGASLLRGGAFKPRTSPYSFQGLGEEGLINLEGIVDAFQYLYKQPRNGWSFEVDVRTSQEKW